MIDSKVEAFASSYPFPLDDFQSEAVTALAADESVLVAAPTGAGKTVVGEFAVWLAIQSGAKAFYTTPLKALSNQKFGDFIALHGAENVGLLTGDNSINPRASVVVMTTEVLRNMIYERSDLLAELRYVVLDEVHYLQDPYRGAVWEEVIIHLPVDVKIVSLSATVSNVEEFAEWIQTVRGTTKAVVETDRPVDLLHHYWINGRLFPMFTASGDAEPNPNSQVIRIEAGFQDFRGRSRGGSRKSFHRGRARRPVAPRPDVVAKLGEEQMLPAIYFIFSRKGCDAAVERCMAEGLRLTSTAERSRIREYAEMRCSHLDDEDLEVLDYSRWLEALASGIASHHAGRVPVFKETVEELFRAGLVKVVFATETLSLGINMPARTVVIESVIKFTGERHELMTPGEFTQLTGRAGRRSIDTLGHAVVLERPDVPFRQVASLASTTVYPLLSSFQPSYNMATNLVRNYSREEAEHLLNSSFAQFRADRDVVVLERRIERNDAYIASYREKMACDRGDFQEYWRLRDRAARLERSMARWEQGFKRRQTRGVLELARPGQVYVLNSGKARGPVVIVGADRSKRGEPRLLALTSNKRLVRLSASDFQRPPKAVATLPLARGLGGWGRQRRVDHQVRAQLAAELAALEISDDPGEFEEDAPEGPADLSKVRTRILQHPCHRCPDLNKHSQWAERATRLDRETAGLRKQVRSRSGTISRKFELLLEILEEHGYVTGFDLTPKGQLLAHIYNESDLLLAETVVRKWLDELDPPEMAALASTFVFESRGPGEPAGRLPTERAKRTFGRVTRLAGQLQARERGVGLEQTRGCQAGFAEIVYDWCRGASLDQILDEDTTPGDFIRWCKQTLDLLRQLQDSVENVDLHRRIGQAVEGINRGVVAYTGVI
ncbi:MAG: DEAD/DEAH box helicase [Actinomycetota bacterium]